MVVLGIDIYSFTDALPVDSRLVNCPELYGTMTELQGNTNQQWKTIFSRNRKLFKENFKYYLLKDSVRSLKMELWDRNKDKGDNDFLANGMMVDRLTKKEDADSVFDLAKGIEVQKTDYLRRYSGFDSLSGRRCEYFETFMKRCKDNNIKLIVFLTPLHPELIQELAQKTTFTQRRQDVISYLTIQCTKNDVRFFDCSDIESFQGIADEFHDGVHATVVNNRLIIDCMVPRIAEKTQNAF